MASAPRDSARNVLLRNAPREIEELLLVRGLDVGKAVTFGESACRDEAAVPEEVRIDDEKRE